MSDIDSYSIEDAEKGNDRAVNVNELVIKPSHLVKYPWNSVLQKSEAEQIAVNIMVILKRTGDNFRNLSWEEYKIERNKDGNCGPSEHGYFDQVIDYCKSADTAKLFSKEWAL